ncbi:hypothetical protein GCM10011344_37910 [Dokdonia pacifica]|nr:VCBS repeat-containing protein [Dokdonia pacifica]GGG33475.1 hypothetical protein GCM10011344_37910 [Dokdonia pacifica]
MFRTLILICLFICPDIVSSQQFSKGELIGSIGFTYGKKARFIHYNKDQFPDILAYPFVHINNGDGHKQETIQFAESENMETLSVADFNNDGLDDVVVLHKDGKIKIFMNSSKGLKELKQKFKIGYYAIEYSDIYVADINADNNLDILINRFGGSIMAFTGDGKGQFEKFKEFRQLFGDFGFVMSKDIDGDGKKEIISEQVTTSGDTNKILVKIRAFKNGNYVEKGSYEIQTRVDVFYIEDIDNDGDLDFVYASEYDNGIYWNERDEQGHYYKKHKIETKEIPITFFLSDMDGDKDLDIVENIRVPPTKPSENFWLENIENGKFSEEKPIVAKHESAYLMITDMNDDGIGDFTEFSVRNGYRISVGINNNMTLVYQDDWVITGSISDFDFLDINNDGIKDIIAASEHRLFYYPVSKNGEISDAVPIIQNENYFNKIILADMDNNGLQDVFWWDERTKIDRVGWYKNLGMGKFEYQEVNLMNTRVPNADLIDFDNDGDIDIVTYEIRRTDGNSRKGFYVYLNENGTFNTPPVTISESDQFKQLFVFDANVDGKLEIIDLSKACECYTSFENKENNTFKVPFLEKCYGFYYNLIMADIDNDSIEDILIDERRKLSWSKVNANKIMQPIEIIEESPNIEKLIYTGDIDNDGDIDILYRTSDYVMVDVEAFMNKYKLMWLENDGTGYFTSHFIGNSSGNSWRIKLHDIDGDGDLDAFQSQRKWHNYGLFIYKNNQKK